jgi:hypothetical protein
MAIQIEDVDLRFAHISASIRSLVGRLPVKGILLDRSRSPTPLRVTRAGRYFGSVKETV